MKYTLTAYFRNKPDHEDDLQVAYVIRDLQYSDVIDLMVGSSCLFSVEKQEKE
jgi:hypothetical protein